MITTRLDRRTLLLRGKREGAFDRDQYYVELAQRGRIARKTRYHLRGTRPVVLFAPPWSRAQRFLDDIAVDLMLGEPAVRCRTLSVAPLAGRTPHQAWSWLVQAVTGFCGLTLRGTAWQVVSRHGFRVVMKQLFHRAEQTGRRCLMIHGLEHVPIEALRDFLAVFEDHLHHRGPDPCFNLVLAGSLQIPELAIHGAATATLEDYSETEALEALVEHLGPTALPRLRALVAAVGGIPAVLDHLGTEGAGRIGDIVDDRRRLWTALGSLGMEIRDAFDAVAADKALAVRLETLAHHGARPFDALLDPPLVRAGFVRRTAEETTDLRAPVFLDLALAL